MLQLVLYKVMPNTLTITVHSQITDISNSRNISIGRALVWTQLKPTFGAFTEHYNTGYTNEMMSLYCIESNIFPAIFHCMKPMNREALVVRLMNISDSSRNS